MKNYLTFLLMLCTLPTFALCSIDSGESACQLTSFRQQVEPIFKENLGNTNLQTPSFKLQPLNREDPLKNMRTPNNELNYNSACQFGVCLQNPNESTLPTPSNIK